MKVKLGVSKRHVHLTEESWKVLFGNKKIEKRNDLGQPGQYASTSTVDLEWNEVRIEHVRVIGPLRKYNQIELAESDANQFGIFPPRRQSGDLTGSLSMKIIGPNGSLTAKECTILAERHVHMSSEIAKSFNVQDKQLIKIYKEGDYLFDAVIKIANPAALELHIDTDEANKYNLETGDLLDFEICGK